MNIYLHGTDVLGADVPRLAPAQPSPIGVIGGTVGFLALGIGGAVLWPQHRIIGFILGSALGWPLGYQFAYMAAK